MAIETISECLDLARNLADPPRIARWSAEPSNDIRGHIAGVVNQVAVPRLSHRLDGLFDRGVRPHGG